MKKEKRKKREINSEVTNVKMPSINLKEKQFKYSYYINVVVVFPKKKKKETCC